MADIWSGNILLPDGNVIKGMHNGVLFTLPLTLHRCRPHNTKYRVRTHSQHTHPALPDDC